MSLLFFAFLLDKRLNRLRNSDTLSRPPRGWIKAIREALGMTTTQFGRRLGVSQSTALGFETSEMRKGIALETLERAARARLSACLRPRPEKTSRVAGRGSGPRTREETPACDQSQHGAGKSAGRRLRRAGAFGKTCTKASESAWLCAMGR